MPESNFVQVGIKMGESFIQKKIQAIDIIDSTGVSAEQHMANTGIHLTPEQVQLIADAIQADQKGAVNGVAPLDADGKIPAQYIAGVLAECNLVRDDYAALLALSAAVAPQKTTVFVSDASGDPTVSSGWAVYFRKATAGTADDWTKLQEGEGLDIDFNQFIKATEKGTANGVATLGGDGKIPNVQIKPATTGAAGISKLNSATDSEAEDESATPKAVKAAMDAASAADTKAGNAQTAAGAAATEAAKLDAAFCTSEADMRTKNLRDGAFVMMQVTV